ncbi:ATP-binding cassette domain-containing protein [Thermochromatium tepidum]|uniref:Probable ATP-binding protein YheS n=1 Tax=Thermochromatium tepidum ATCC 43061 TaxID=316276 RepID=A0A6I6E623_THETI|nr:ATP-binding cassette domain-containing protein [Thermochromatium tepidum]QGU32123.1 ATP-binding cassette domain-containing protein [Thermochromatium tepidum ATCC 43061]
MLQLKDLSFRRGPNRLLEGATLSLYPGWKVGLVGANGCGKSSLLALLRDELHAEAGEVVIPPGWEIAHVAQHTPDTDRPAIEFVLDGDRELRRLQSELAEAEASGQGLRQAELHGRLESIGAYEATSRAARLLHGLGFAPGEERRPVDSYSGGWRRRLALARTLMSRSDLLLLDEPTNHLDLDAVIWLEGWLKAYAGTLILISHDRDFLDAVVGHTLHLEHRRLTLYMGNYSAFERQRAERLAQQQSAYVRQQHQIAQMRRFVERFRAKATKARQAQSRLKALERLERIAPAHVDSPFRFGFEPPDHLPRPLLRLEAAVAGYGERTVLDGVGFSLAPGDRIGLLGRNGAGKSTLIKVLAGTLPLQSGRCERAQELKIGYFAQHQLDQLRPDDSPLAHLRRLDPQATEQALRDYLGGFGFAGNRALEPVAPLSGGEKARLVLALIIRQRPNLLLLDEPTNHLDLEMRQALAEALQEFDGALVLVSHDRHLLRVTSDTLWLVDGGAVRPFDGDLDDYPAWLAGRQLQDQQRRSKDSGPSERGSERKQQRRQAAEARKALQPLRTREKALERRLAELGERRAALEQELAAPELYEPAAKDRLLRLLDEQRRLQADLEDTETAWLEVSEAIENFQTDDA